MSDSSDTSATLRTLSSPSRLLLWARYISKVTHLLLHLGCVDLDFECSTVCLILLARGDGNLAELAGQIGKMVEHPNPS